jgi:hypothetical protein
MPDKEESSILAMSLLLFNVIVSPTPVPSRPPLCQCQLPHSRSPSNLRILIFRFFPLLCVHVFAHSRDRLGPIAPLEEYSEVNGLTNSWWLERYEIRSSLVAHRSQEKTAGKVAILENHVRIAS